MGARARFRDQRTAVSAYAEPAVNLELLQVLHTRPLPTGAPARGQGRPAACSWPHRPDRVRAGPLGPGRPPAAHKHCSCGYSGGTGGISQVTWQRFRPEFTVLVLGEQKPGNFWCHPSLM